MSDRGTRIATGQLLGMNRGRLAHLPTEGGGDGPPPTFTFVDGTYSRSGNPMVPTGTAEGDTGLLFIEGSSSGGGAALTLSSGVGGTETWTQIATVQRDVYTTLYIFQTTFSATPGAPVISAWSETANHAAVLLTYTGNTDVTLASAAVTDDDVAVDSNYQPEATIPADEGELAICFYGDRDALLSEVDAGDFTQRDLQNNASGVDTGIAVYDAISPADSSTLDAPEIGIGQMHAYIRIVLTGTPAPAPWAVSDDFDRADSATIGGDWTELDAGWSISSNQIVNSTAGHQKLLHNDTDAPADYYVQMDHIAGGGGTGLFIRGDATFDNGYFGRLHPDGYQLFRVDSGSFTLLDSESNEAYPKTLKLEAVGSAIKLYGDGVEKCSATDATHSGANTRFGIRGFTDGTVDNFEAGEA